MTEEHQQTRTTSPHIWHTTQQTITTLTLITRTMHLNPLLPLSMQLHLLNLFGGDNTLYESFHAVVSCRVKPWFNVFVGTRAGAGKYTGGGGGEAKLGIPMTKKKFARPELSCLQLRMWTCRRWIWLFILLFNVLLTWWVLPSSDDDVPLTWIKSQSQGQLPNISKHPIKAPHWQHVPQLSPIARELMDQSHTSGDAHEERFIWHGIARSQLLDALRGCWKAQRRCWGARGWG